MSPREYPFLTCLIITIISQAVNVKGRHNFQLHVKHGVVWLYQTTIWPILKRSITTKSMWSMGWWLILINGWMVCGTQAHCNQNAQNVHFDFLLSSFRNVQFSSAVQQQIQDDSVSKNFRDSLKITPRYLASFRRCMRHFWQKAGVIYDQECQILDQFNDWPY